MNKSILIIPLLAAVVLLVLPFAVYSGDRIMVVTSTSMVPTLMPNDLIVVEPATLEQVKEGDIIAMDSHTDTGIVVHRAIAIGNDSAGNLGIDTQGDNNESPDPWTVYDDSMIGIVQDRIPYLGILLVSPVRYSLVAVIVIASAFLLKENIRGSK